METGEVEEEGREEREFKEDSEEIAEEEEEICERRSLRHDGQTPFDCR